VSIRKKLRGKKRTEFPGEKSPDGKKGENRGVRRRPSILKNNLGGV